MTNIRTITVPAGIGDFIWLAMKLASTKEMFHVKLPDSTPQRGHQILQLLPDIVASHEYTPGLSYKKIAQANVAIKGKRWADLKQKELTISANTHLESGFRIEKFLPDLPTTFLLDYATSDEDKEMSKRFVTKTFKKNIGIYASAYSNARNWNMWDHEEWFYFIKMMHDRCKDYRFVIIGASYDTDLAQLLMLKLQEHKIPYIGTIGQPLKVVVEILKRLDYFIGFPSGLSILNESLGKDGCMFYPPHLIKMMNAWAHPDRIAAGNYKGCQKCLPGQLFNWLKDDYKLFER